MSNLPLLISLTDDLDRLTMAPYFSPYYEPACLCRRQRNPLFAPDEKFRQLANLMDEDPNTSFKVGKDGFQVCINVSDFKPSELNVKVVDRSIYVEGKHEERKHGRGFITRQTMRRYELPQGYEEDKVTCTLSSDGVLTVSAPKPAAIEDKNPERIVQIQQVGPAHLNVKENAKEQPEQEAVKDK